MYNECFYFRRVLCRWLRTWWKSCCPWNFKVHWITVNQTASTLSSELPWIFRTKRDYFWDARFENIAMGSEYGLKCYRLFALCKKREYTYSCDIQVLRSASADMFGCFRTRTASPDRATHTKVVPSGVVKSKGTPLVKWSFGLPFSVWRLARRYRKWNLGFLRVQKFSFIAVTSSRKSSSIIGRAKLGLPVNFVCRIIISTKVLQISWRFFAFNAAWKVTWGKVVIFHGETLGMPEMCFLVFPVGNFSPIHYTNESKMLPRGLLRDVHRRTT